VYCSLQEIAGTYLPALKKAIDATNKAYGKYAHDEAAKHQHRIYVWT
jgi:hypothetical protein